MSVLIWKQVSDFVCFERNETICLQSKWNKNKRIKLPSDVRENTLGKCSLRVHPPTAPERERFSLGGGYSHTKAKENANPCYLS